MAKALFAPEVPLVSPERTTATLGPNESEERPQSQNSFNSFNSINSEKWSQQGLNSKAGSATINIEDGKQITGARRRSAKTKHKGMKKKLFGNYILPGVCGIYSCRVVDKLHYKHPISQTLLNNTIGYCFKIREFIRNDLLYDMKDLATLLYFPTGQIEADGLSAISAEAWAATYLLLGLHKHIREADFHNIRSAYSSLAWDSGRTYRCTLHFYRCLRIFRTKIIPLWNQVEEVAGITANNDFAEIDSIVRLSDERAFRPPPETEAEQNPTLPKIRIHDDFILENALTLQLVPERKSQAQMEGFVVKEATFDEIGYGKQMEVIKALITKPVKTLHAGAFLFSNSEPRLMHEKMTAIDRTSKKRRRKKSKKKLKETELKCSTAIKILVATLKLLFEEVNLTSALRMDITEWIRSVSDDINAYFAYSEWVCNKFSEFHSMIRLCYNFAMICYDLDLPKFEIVIKHEALHAPAPAPHRGRTGKAHAGKITEEAKQEYKVVSLTELMESASASFIAPGKTNVDDDFNWQDFYKTDYSNVIQRLPLRLGNNLLQFEATPSPQKQKFVRQRVDAKRSSSGEALKFVPTAKPLRNVNNNNPALQ